MEKDKNKKETTTPSKVKVTLKYKDEKDNVIETSSEIDKDVQLPVNLGVVTLLSLGKVDLRKNFHNERYIFPVGYKSERSYNSYLNPSEKIQYTCEILEDPNSDSPVFQVTPKDNPEDKFTSSTPTGAWTPIIKKVQESRKKIGGKRQYSTVSGPEYFGLSHPKCRELLNTLENADKCESYQETKETLEDETFELEPESEEEAPKIRKSKRQAITKMEQLEPKPSKKTKQAEFPGLSPDRPFLKLLPYQFRFLTQELQVFDGYEPFVTMYKKEVAESQKFQLTNVNPSFQFGIFPPTNGTTQPLMTQMTKPQLFTAPQNFPKQTEIVKTDTDVQKVSQEVLKQTVQTIPTTVNNVMLNQTPIPTTKPMPNVVTQIPMKPKIDFESEVKLLRSMWEFSFVCHSLSLLRPILKIAEFTPLELEKAFINPGDHNGLLADIHIRLIKGPAIDRKAYESLNPNSLSWIRITQNKLDTVDTYHWGGNPLRKEKYINISPSFRVLILKSIIDWKVINNQKCSDYIHNLDEILRFDPLGFDKDDNIYWYFGEEVGRLFKESTLQEKKSKSDEEHKKSHWSTCCDSLGDFKDFIQVLSCSLNENELKLCDSLKYIYPTLENYKNEAELRSKQRTEQRILDQKRREEEERKKEERRMKQRLYQEARRKEMDDYQQRLMSQMSTSMTTTTRSSFNTPEKKETDEEFNGRTRSGRAIRRRMVIENEEREEQAVVQDDEPLSLLKKKNARDDEEFRLSDDEISEDEELSEDIISDEEPFEDELIESDFESDEEYNSPKKSSFKITPQKTSGNQKNFFIPSSNNPTYKPLAPIMTSFRQQPVLPQVPLATSGQPNPMINSPSFQAYYQQYLKLMVEQQKKSGNVPLMNTMKPNPTAPMYQNVIPTTQNNLNPKPAPKIVTQKSQPQSIQKITISQNVEKESTLMKQDNFFNMPEADFTAEEMDTIDSVLSNQRDLE